ncbi:MAG: hypothetical protein GY716_14350 [bacterium]|nr:hypothetical protein [bacterium]
MSCNQWNDEWVAALYDELDPAERSRMSQHVSTCEACRTTLDELAATGAALRTAAPEVPLAPRVVILKPAPRFRGLWGYVAAFAGAAALFLAGVLATDLFVTPERQPLHEETAVLGDVVTRAEMIEALEQQQAQFDAMLARSGGARPQQPRGNGDAMLTTAQFRTEMDSLRSALEVNRSRDVEFLLEEINAAEARTGTWTREALRYIVLEADDRFTQR